MSLSEKNAEALIPDEDFALLVALADKASRDKTPTCKELLEQARVAEPEAMRGINARRVSDILKRYGLATLRSSGRSIFRDTLRQLRSIEERYGIDLNTAGQYNVRLLQARMY